LPSRSVAVKVKECAPSPTSEAAAVFWALSVGTGAVVSFAGVEEHAVKESARAATSTNESTQDNKRLSLFF